MSCCGGDAGAKILNAKAMWGAPIAGRGIDMADNTADVRLEFKGPQKGGISYNGKVTGRVYRAGNNDFERYIDASPADVEFLTSLVAPGGNAIFEVVDKSVLELPEVVQINAGEPALVDTTPPALGEPGPDLTPGVNPAELTAPEQTALDADKAAAQNTETAANLDSAGLLDGSKSTGRNRGN